MRKLLAVLCIMCMMLTVLAGCGKTTAPSSTPEPQAAAETAEAAQVEEPRLIKVGLCTSSLVSVMGHINDILEEACGNMTNVEYHMTNADMNGTQQISDFENLVEMGCEVIVLKSVDQYSLGTVIKNAQEKDGVTVICLDSKVFDADGKDACRVFSGNSDAEIGKMLVDKLVETMGEEGKIVINAAAPQATVFADRVAAALAELENYPNIEVLTAEGVGVGRVAAQELCENWIAAYGDEITGCISVADENTYGCINAFNDADMDVKIVTANGDMEMFPFISSGDVYCCLSLNSSIHPTIGIIRWIQEGYVAGTDFPSEWYGSVVPVTKELADKFYNEVYYRIEDAKPQAENPQYVPMFEKYSAEYPLVAEYDFFDYIA